MRDVVQRLCVILFFVLMISLLLMINVKSVLYAQSPVSSEIANKLQTLSVEQKQLVEREIDEPGSVLTPETIQLLEEYEMKGITAEDIMKGKKILDENETSKKPPAEKKQEQNQKQDKPALKAVKKTTSLFDRYRDTDLYQSISYDLKPFGYDFFQAMEKPLTPRQDIPVSSDYIIGPGDEIKILLWGRVNAQYNLVVNKDGEITIPNIGPLEVAGMNFEQMNNYLTAQTKKIIGAKINVSMGALKSIQVFVLGEVRRPGSYALDSFSTITNAIFASGGPTDIGSLRKVQLKRNHKNVIVMDFYDFMLKGDKSQDQVLQSGDVVFVPTVGPLVGIAGDVKRPAIYELRNENDLMSLFTMAGGLTPSAYTQQIQVERIQRNERQIVVDINDKDLATAKSFILQDGDLVKVFSIVDKNVNAIFLYGNIKRPGKYEYKAGMRVKDLIRDTSDVLKETYFEYALIKRIQPPAFRTKLIPFNLVRLLFDNDDASNISLQPQDSIYVFSKWLFKDRPFVTVEGEVRNLHPLVETGDQDNGQVPSETRQDISGEEGEKGTISAGLAAPPLKIYLFENSRIRDVILEAGGLSKDASLQKGEIFRTDEAGMIKQIYFNVGNALAEDSEENLLLQDRDRIVIHSVWEERDKLTVSIDGDIKNPGEYPLAEDMRVSDLVFAAGNILESAYLGEAELSSFTVDDGKRFRTDYRTINLGSALDNDPVQNVLLKPGDRVFVKRIPEWQEKKFVSVSGEINFPGRYIIKKGETLSSLIERAGGYADGAYLKAAVFTRESARRIQQESINAMVERLERELLIEGSTQVATAISKEEVEAKKVELDQQQKFIASLRNLKATGRMSIRLAHLRLLKNGEYDIELEEGDSLFIPPTNSMINVVGSVMSRGSFVYSDKFGYKDYIEMAGGLTRYADEDNVYILKVDGTAMKVPQGLLAWNSPKNRWQLTAFDDNIKNLEAGDSIVVPEKLDRIAWLREIKDITQILFQIATTAGVVFLLF